MLSAVGRPGAVYRRTLDDLELKPPLFLVGHWRSGTTLLHELLALDESFAAPSTYACFNPHHFLLARHGAPSTKSAERPTGDMIISPFSPQEDEFALLCMGAISPYEAFVFPSALHQFEALCDPDGFERTQQQMERCGYVDIEGDRLPARRGQAVAGEISSQLVSNSPTRHALSRRDVHSAGTRAV